MGFLLAPGEYVRFRVSDTGHGMSRETVARMFDPFYTTKPVGQGTGLGLSMVYGIVKQHSGYVGARSVLGRGTTIEIFWPALAEPPEAERAPTDDPWSGTGGHGRVVLVADDEPLVRALVVRTLELEGYTVHAAKDGEAALQLVDGGTVVPDLLVTDIIMPGLNGRQLHEVLLTRRRDLPVLYISGHTGDDVVFQRLVPPGAPFLQKPFTPDALGRATSELLGRTPRPRPR
jgi:CheY-like chemotaxis protein